MAKTQHKEEHSDDSVKEAPKTVAKPTAIENAPQLNGNQLEAVQHAAEVGIAKDVAIKIVQRHFENAAVLRQLK